MGNMSKIYGTQIPEEMVVPLVKLSTRYINFCREPLDQPAKWRADFWQLCGHPMVTAISFATDGSLLLGIKEIILTDKQTGISHRLGEYLVTMRRFQENIRNVTFECMTPLFTSQGVYHHPHISSMHLCMIHGREQMMHALTRGDIPEVFEYVIKILNTIDSNPFYPARLELWPKA